MKFTHLDAIRGGAAILVLLSHARGFSMVGWAAVEQKSAATFALYLASSLGHQAVIVFFTLSGFLVGGPLLTSLKLGQWSVFDYFLARVTRLWVVLIPALFLTIGFDTVGAVFFNPEGYNGAYVGSLPGVPSGDPVQYSLHAFLGNLVFLQNVLVPTFGTNNPLWSLANEFWYYAIAPVFFAGCFFVANRQKFVSGFIMLAASVLILKFIPLEMMLLGIVWLAGAVARVVTRTNTVADDNMLPVLVCVITFLAAIFSAVLASRVDSLIADIFCGILWAICLPLLARHNPQHRFYVTASDFISKFSFSLYAIHYPIVCFLSLSILGDYRFQPNLMGLSVLMAILSFAFVSSYFFWWVFEKRTNTVRGFLRMRLAANDALFEKK